MVLRLSSANYGLSQNAGRSCSAVIFTRVCNIRVGHLCLTKKYVSYALQFFSHFDRKSNCPPDLGVKANSRDCFAKIMTD